MFNCTVEITVPLATALYHGIFIWDKPDSPSNYYSLLFGKPSALALSGAREAMILHLKAEKGGGWSDIDLGKALCQAIVIPFTINSMLHSIHNFASASSLFFSAESLHSIGFASWPPHISSNLLTYESISINDLSLIASILTAIDTRVNCWLSECANLPLHCNVEDSLINFSDIQRHIKTRQFQFQLPPSIRSHINSSKKRSTDTDSNQDNNNDTKRVPVTNPS